MEFEMWHYWILAAILFFLLEIFVPSFIMASIGLGCILAFTGSLLGGSLTVQIVLFIAGTVAGFTGVKPVMKKYAYRKKSLETNASGLIGRTGKVIEEINETKNTGSVAIDGDVWTGISSTGETIPAGSKVRVIELNSIVLTVEPLNEIHEQENDLDNGISNPRERITLKLGNKTFFVATKEIALIYSSNKTTYLVTREGKEYIHDKSLDLLCKELSSKLFFRANRQYILTRHVISTVKSDHNGKLRVELIKGANLPIVISVSRLKAAAFRDWMKLD